MIVRNSSKQKKAYVLHASLFIFSNRNTILLFSLQNPQLVFHQLHQFPEFPQQFQLQLPELQRSQQFQLLLIDFQQLLLLL
jgi:hypothetical protein